MHINDTIHTEVNQEFEILTDKDKNGKERPWREKKMSTILLSESYERLGFKKAYRVIDCATYLEFKKLSDGTKKLYRANFCKVRLCPMCSWRRSRKIYGQVSKVMNKALEERDYRFIFLTLTCRNIEGEELSETIDNLFRAFKKLTERKVFRQAVKGWFRGLEVTHNLDKASASYDTYHPHFHVILMVNKSYFKKSEIYISQRQWTSLWQDCLGVDYTPIVDVRTFRTSTKDHLAKSLAESAKYTVKDNDYLVPDDLEMTDDAVMVLDYALANRRLIAFGGELRKIHKELNLDDAENGDLVNTHDEEIREDLEYIIEHYRWHIGYRQYVKMEL